MALVQDEGNSYLKTSSSVAVTQREQDVVKRSSTESFSKDKSHYTDEKSAEDPEVNSPVEEDEERGRHGVLYSKIRPFILPTLALVIVGWWISATILKATRHRWIVQTFFAWSFIAIIAFRYIPNSVVTRPVEAVWVPVVQRPWYRISYPVRLAIGWLCLDDV
jgi:CNT family concentrative nucleoside transporter